MRATAIATSSLALLLPVAAFAASGPPPPSELAEFFRPPEKYRGDFGSYRSPLVFADGSRVQSAKDWPRRRTEILQTWHKAMGPWPALIEQPRVETVTGRLRLALARSSALLLIAGRWCLLKQLTPNGCQLYSTHLLGSALQRVAARS